MTPTPSARKVRENPKFMDTAIGAPIKLTMPWAELAGTTLPSGGSVDIARELATIRAILEMSGGERADKIGRALDDAAEEASKPQPDKDEIGKALDWALGYAKTSGSPALG